MLTFDDDLLLIADSRGVQRPYSWSLLTGIGCAFAVRLERVDSGNSYVVRHGRHGWSCTCPAARWRRGPCKHVRCGQVLEALCRKVIGDNRGVAREVAS